MKLYVIPAVAMVLWAVVAGPFERDWWEMFAALLAACCFLGWGLEQDLNE